MRLSLTTIEKFNRYFQEILEYYELSHMAVYSNAYNGLHVCKVSALAERLSVEIYENHPNDMKISFIHGNYPLLTPFYKLYLSYYNTRFSKSAGEMYLRQINDSMKVCRLAKTYSSQG